MMRRMMLAGAMMSAVTLAALSVDARAETMSYAQAGAIIARSCGPSIQKHCSRDNIGTGQVLGCLKEHKASVPSQCFADFEAVVASIGTRVAAQTDAYKLCQADIAQYCQGVKPGNGYIRDCLVASKRVVQGACRQALIDAGWY